MSESTRRRSSLSLALAAAAALAGLLSLAGERADGGINLKNGNFYISYSDLAWGSIDVSRTYNSKSTYKGLFGFGWGGSLETYLDVQGDGSVVVHWNGAGSLRRYYPVGSDETAVDAAVDRILWAARRTGELGSDADADAFRAKIAADAELRDIFWRRYVREGLLRNRSIPVGTRLEGQRGEVRRVRGGYVLDEGRVGTSHRFDDEGRLVLQTFPNGRFVRIVRDGRGRIRRLVNEEGNRAEVIHDAAGRLSRIEADGKKISYEIDDRGDLRWTRDVAGNAYGYDYDDNHNMVAIKYADGRRRVIGYTPKTQYANYFRDRLGRATEYLYETNPEKPAFDYWTTMTYRSPSGEVVGESRHHWIVGADQRGRQSIRQLTVTRDGEVWRLEVDPDEGTSRATIPGEGTVETAGLDEVVVTEERPEAVVVRTFSEAYRESAVRIVTTPAEEGAAERVERFDLDERGRVVWAGIEGEPGMTVAYGEEGIDSIALPDGARLVFDEDEQERDRISLVPPGSDEPVGSISHSGETAKALEGDVDPVFEALQRVAEVLRPAYLFERFEGQKIRPRHRDRCSNCRVRRFAEEAALTGEAELLLLRARAYRQVGELERARRDLEALVGLHPDHADARLQLVRTLALQAADGADDAIVRAIEHARAYARLPHTSVELLTADDYAAVRADPRFEDIFPTEVDR